MSQCRRCPHGPSVTVYTAACTLAAVAVVLAAVLAVPYTPLLHCTAVQVNQIVDFGGRVDWGNLEGQHVRPVRARVGRRAADFASNFFSWPFPAYTVSPATDTDFFSFVSGAFVRAPPAPGARLAARVNLATLDALCFEMWFKPFTNCWHLGGVKCSGENETSWGSLLSVHGDTSSITLRVFAPPPGSRTSQEGYALLSGASGSVNVPLGPVPHAYRSGKRVLFPKDDWVDVDSVADARQSAFLWRHISLCANASLVRVIVNTSPRNGTFALHACGNTYPTEMEWGGMWDTFTVFDAAPAGNATNTTLADVLAGLGGSAEVVLGADPASGASFSGFIDDVRVWGRWADPGDPDTGRGTALTGTEAGLLHLWTFDDPVAPLADAAAAPDARALVAHSGTPPSGLHPSAAAAVAFVEDAPLPVFRVVRDLEDEGNWTALVPARFAFVNQTHNWTVNVSAPGDTGGAALTVVGAPAGGAHVPAGTLAGALDALAVRVALTRVHCFAREFALTLNAAPAGNVSSGADPFPPVDVTLRLPNASAGTLEVHAGGETLSAGAGVYTSGNDSAGNRAVFVAAGQFGPTGPARGGEEGSLAGAPRALEQGTVGGGRAEFPVGEGVGADLAVALHVCGADLSLGAFSYAPPVVDAVAYAYGDAGTRVGTLNVTGRSFGRASDSATTVRFLPAGAGSGVNTSVPCNVTVWLAPHAALACTIAWPAGFGPAEIAASRVVVTVAGQASAAATIGGAPPPTSAPAVDGSSPHVPPQERLFGALWWLVLAAGTVALCAVLAIGLVAAGAGWRARTRWRRAAERAGGEVPLIPVHKRDFSALAFGAYAAPAPAARAAAGDLDGLAELLFADGAALALEVAALTQITEADTVARALVAAAEVRGATLALLKALVTAELNGCDDAGTLFRSNSMVSKVFKFWTRLVALPYVYTTLAPALAALVAQNKGLEVDPERMDEGRDLHQMRWELMAQSQRILRAILDSADACPPALRDLCAHVRDEVAGRFPDAVAKTIGGFVFLRFFCPAVTAPESYGIVDEPPAEESRRLLILITKVLQNLSNNVEFGAKEPYMEKMNDFIHTNSANIERFLCEELARTCTEPVQPVPVPRDLVDASLVRLSEHIRDIFNDMAAPELQAALRELRVAPK